MTPGACDRVLLVGFMGSGKSSVGRAVAERLGWRFVDFDDEIVAEAGTSIPDIFRGKGEPHFRELENRVARRLLAEKGVVLGSGGGWGAVPGRMSSEVPEGTASFWLRVSAPTAVKRAAGEPGARPLLAGPDPLEEASRLLSERERFYAEAQWTVDTEHCTVEDVAARILEILKREHPEVLRACSNE
ncbi:MAG: shikimate kinase [Gemmatimonadota bacterium]